MYTQDKMLHTTVTIGTQAVKVKLKFKTRQNTTCKLHFVIHYKIEWSIKDLLNLRKRKIYELASLLAMAGVYSKAGASFSMEIHAKRPFLLVFSVLLPRRLGNITRMNLAIFTCLMAFEIG